MTHEASRRRGTSMHIVIAIIIVVIIIVIVIAIVIFIVIDFNRCYLSTAADLASSTLPKHLPAEEADHTNVQDQTQVRHQLLSHRWSALPEWHLFGREDGSVTSYEVCDGDCSGQDVRKEDHRARRDAWQLQDFTHRQQEENGNKSLMMCMGSCS